MGFRFAACFDCFALCLVSYLALANTRLLRRGRYREQRLPGVGETEISVDTDGSGTGEADRGLSKRGEEKQNDSETKH